MFLRLVQRVTYFETNFINCDEDSCETVTSQLAVVVINHLYNSVIWTIVNLLPLTIILWVLLSFYTGELIIKAEFTQSIHTLSWNTNFYLNMCLLQIRTWGCFSTVLFIVHFGVFSPCDSAVQFVVVLASSHVNETADSNTAGPSSHMYYLYYEKSICFTNYGGTQLSSYLTYIHEQS